MHFAEFGVVMMLFVVGLELRPSMLWRLRGPILGLDGPGRACRLVFSEADGLSGLTVDRYDRWLAAQFSELGYPDEARELSLQLLARGQGYRELWTAREQQHSRSTQWLQRRQKRRLSATS